MNNQTNEVTDMPEPGRKVKWEWAYFMDSNGRKAYNKLCLRCIHDCKQSFRAVVVECRKYQSKRGKCG